MVEDNLTAVLYKARDLRLEQRPIPEPGPGEVLVRVVAVGICGSDLHYWWSGRTARFVVERPLVLGHETAGQIVKCGPGVTNLKPGDRVALEPGIPCRRCQLCHTGKYNVCPSVQFHATPPVDGTLTRLVVHPHDFCFRLPPQLSCVQGALLEPLAVAVHSCRRAEVALGSRVLVTGAGPIGQVSLLAAKAMGATAVCVTDINPGRLAFAEQLGATSTVNVGGLTSKQAEEAVMSAMGGEGPTAVLECSGADSSLLIAVQVGSPGCIIVMIGRGSPEVPLPIALLTTKEMEIRGIFRYANCYQAALDMLSAGLIDVQQLVSHTFDLGQVQEAFEAAKTGIPIKVMIIVGKEEL